MHKFVEEHTMSDLFCLSLSLHCTHEIDLLTLSMLHHFDKTLSRSKTYHSLSKVENGIYDCLQYCFYSKIKFQVIS